MTGTPPEHEMWLSLTFIHYLKTMTTLSTFYEKNLNQTFSKSIVSCERRIYLILVEKVTLKKITFYLLLIAISAIKNSKSAAEKARNTKCSISKFTFFLGFLS